MSDLLIPDELFRFLNNGLQLQYDFRAAEPGRIILLDYNALTLGRFAVHSRGKEQAARDPNRGRNGRYSVPAVNLVASCDGHTPEGILVWLPHKASFGTWDCDHADLWIFPDVMWSEIEADPLSYVNALWYPNRVEREWLEPWWRYPFIPDEGAGSRVGR